MLSNTGAAVVLLLTGMVATPFLLRLLGTERFGVFRALTDLVGYVSLLDLGLAGALRAEFGVAAGRDDEPQIRAITAAGAQIYFRISAAMIFSGLILTVVAPYMIGLHEVSASELRWAGLISLLPFALTAMGVCRIIAEAKQRGYIMVTLVTAQLLVTTMLSLFFASRGWGLIGQAAASSIAQVPVAIYLIWFARKNYPGLSIRGADKEVQKRIWHTNWPNLIFTASSRLGLVSDNIVVAWALGSTLVAPFYLTQRLVSIAQAQVQNVGNSTWAALVQMHASGDSAGFRERLLQLTSIVSALGIVAVGTITAYNHHFLARWLGPGVYGGDWVNGLSALNMWLMGIFSLWAWPLSGAGFMNKLAPYAAWAMVVNVICSVGGAFFLGTPGPLVGTLASFLLVNTWAYSRLMSDCFDVEPKELWRAALQHLIWGVPYTAATWFIAHSHTPSTMFYLLAEMSAAGLAGTALWWSCGLNLTERDFWRSRVLVLAGKYS